MLGGYALATIVVFLAYRILPGRVSLWFMWITLAAGALFGYQYVLVYIAVALGAALITERRKQMKIVSNSGKVVVDTEVVKEEAKKAPKKARHGLAMFLAKAGQSLKLDDNDPVKLELDRRHAEGAKRERTAEQIEAEIRRLEEKLKAARG